MFLNPLARAPLLDKDGTYSLKGTESEALQANALTSFYLYFQFHVTSAVNDENLAIEKCTLNI